MRTGSHGRVAVWIVVGLLAAAPVAAQNAAREAIPQPGPMLIGPPPPPATLIEGFRAPLGSVVTVGYEVVGEVAGVAVDARELRDSSGGRVRGVVVEVAQEKGPTEQSYVDVDELSDLLKGMDRLLNVIDNPTQFKNFEMHYATKGELELTASSTRNRGVLFTVEAGRMMKARQRLTSGELQQLRTLVEAAAQKLATLVDK